MAACVFAPRRRMARTTALHEARPWDETLCGSYSVRERLGAHISASSKGSRPAPVAASADRNNGDMQ